MSINLKTKCKKNPLAFPSSPSKKNQDYKSWSSAFHPRNDARLVERIWTQTWIKLLRRFAELFPFISLLPVVWLANSSNLSSPKSLSNFLLLRFYFFHPLRPMFSAWASYPHIWFENYGQEESQLHLCAFPFSSFCAIYWVYLIPLISCFSYSEYFYSC